MGAFHPSPSIRNLEARSPSELLHLAVSGASASGPISSRSGHRSEIDRCAAVVYDSTMKFGRLDFQQRAKEKQRARDADEADLAAGRRSADEISRSNSMFGSLDPSVFKKARIHFPEKR